MSFRLPRCLGPCLALCPEYSFILEDELGVCGCVLGVLDVRSFAKRCQASWMPAMRDKYPPRGGNTHPNTQVNKRSRRSKDVIKQLFLSILKSSGVCVTDRHTCPTHWLNSCTQMLDISVPAVTPSGSLCYGLITHWEVGRTHR